MPSQLPPLAEVFEDEDGNRFFKYEDAKALADSAESIIQEMQRKLDSTKASMEILARAILDISVHEIEVDGVNVESLAAVEAKKAIAAVKANGDWPLENDT